jgi:hypothetical protein
MAPVISVTISGEFSIEDIANLLKKQWPDKNIKLDKSEPQGGQGSSGIQGNPKDISVMYSASGEQLQYYKNLLERKALKKHSRR